MKRLLSIFLIIALIGGCIPMMVGAEETPAVYHLLSDCETTSGWATEKTYGSLELSSDAAVGNGSVQVTCQKEMYFFLISQSGQLDFTNVTHLDFWFYTSDPKIFSYGDCGFNLSYSDAWYNEGVAVTAPSFKNITLQVGWNHLTVPLDFSGYTEAYDIEHIGRFRFYSVGLPDDVTFTVAVDDVKAVNMKGLEQADQLVAQEVINKIDAIGTVNTYSRLAIAAARSAYNGLSETQKAMVTNYSELTAAETAFAAMNGPQETTYVTLSNCDTMTGWEARNSVNTTTKTEGTGSIQQTVTTQMMYYFNNTNGYDFAGATHMEFDLYVEDTSFFKHGDCGMNLSSVGTGVWWSEQGIQVQAAAFKALTLTSGWNHIKVPLTYLETPAESFDVNKVTNIRFYAVGFTAETIVMIDDFKVVYEVLQEIPVTIPDDMKNNKPELSKEQDAWLISSCGETNGLTVSSCENKNVVSVDGEDFTVFTALSAGTVEVKALHLVSSPISITDLSKEDLALRLQFYVSNAAAIKSNGQLELTSGGRPDSNELHFRTPQLELKDGWNVVYLDLVDGVDSNGTLDITNINYMRLYMFLTADVVMAFDDIKLVKRQVVSVNEDFAEGDSLLKWSGVNAQLTRENESLVINGNGEVCVASSSYALPIVHPDRTPVEFTLFTETPEAISDLVLVLTDGKGRTATAQLDPTRMNGLAPTGYQVVPSEMTADAGFNSETVTTVTLQATMENATLVMDNFEVNVRNGQYWRDWVYNYTPSVGDYSIAVIPDIQELTAIYPQKLNTIMDWLVANKEKENLQFAIDVGDVTWNGHSGNETEFQTAAAAFQKLQDAGIDYSIAYGNHDYTPGTPRNTALFNQYFPFSNMSSFDSYGGTMTDGKVDNMYYCFEVQGNKYMVLSLEFDPLAETVAWANQVIEQHKEYQVMVVTHNYMNNVYEQYSYAGQNLWPNLVSKHENIIMVICGHDFLTDDPGSLNYRQDKGENGNTVHQLMVNSQDIDAARGGVGLLLMMRFTNGGKTIDLNYFSPVNDDLAYKPQNQFTLYLDDNQDEDPDYAAMAKEVDDMIAALPETNVDASYRDEIDAIKDAINALPEEAFELMENLAQFTFIASGVGLAELLNTYPDDPEQAELTAGEWAALETTLAEKSYNGQTLAILTPTLAEKYQRYMDYAATVADITYGDVDGDGEVTAADALEVLKSVVGKVTLTEEQMVKADVDGNEKVEAADALDILKKVVGKIDQFAVEA